MQVVYTDVTGTSETRSDTALAVEIATSGVAQFYEDANYSDDVDTYQPRQDAVYVVVYDTDENKNPQSVETVAVTVYVGNGSGEGGGAGLVLDTEALVLTESGETTGIFRSYGVALVDTENPLTSSNGRLVAGLGDTLHVTYTDTNDEIGRASCRERV